MTAAQARVLLVASLLPFLWFAVRDQILHLRARRVSVAENVIHLLLGMLLTIVIARAFLFKGKYVTLMNVAADAEVAPELIQTKFTPENVAAAAAPLLDDEDAREEQVRRQDEALAKMGRGGTPAAEIAADAVLNVLAQPRAPTGT